MGYHIFDSEQYQSMYENNVSINLADSSVKCVSIREWLNIDEQQSLLDTNLFYPQVNGTRYLREQIASHYPDATADNILVTVGASEAGLILCETLLEAGDEVIVISPGYRQIYGLAKNKGCIVRELHLDATNQWQLDLDELAALITDKTRLMSIVNPNNPTGTILSHYERCEIVKLCANKGIWLHVDEVYQGTELSGEETPTFWGSYDKLVVTNSLSKAYRLAGLRIGWIVAETPWIQSFWRRHEYAVIAASGPSMKLAEFALEKSKRQFLLNSQRKLSIDGRAVVSAWIKKQDGLFSMHDSPATSICFVRYHFAISSHQLAEKIRQNCSVLVAPGAFLGAEHHLRITAGYECEKVQTALDRITEVVEVLLHDELLEEA